MPRKLESPPRVKIALVPEKIARAMSVATDTGIDSGLLLREVIECFGGPRRFAQEIFAQYQLATPHGKHKILEYLSRLTVQTTAQNLARPRPVSDFSEDELASAGAHLMEKIGGRSPTSGTV